MKSLQTALQGRINTNYKDTQSTFSLKDLDGATFE